MPHPDDDRLVSELASREDVTFDQDLRPSHLEEFVGQERLKRNLSIYLEAARQRGEAVDHILFSGPPGLGKTTLGHIIAHEMDSVCHSTSGPVLERPRDLIGMLSKLEPGDIFFVDEIHRLPRAVEEYLYSAMEDYEIDVSIGEGVGAKSVKVGLNRFTLIGSTTREGALTAPFRARFGILEKIDYYPPDELRTIIVRSAGILGIAIRPAAAEELARRARGTPRIANRFLRRTRDLAQVREHDTVDAEIAREGLEMLGVDEDGLDRMDRKILETVGQYGGSPVGLKTIAISVGEDEETIEDVYEPYLIREGYLRKTPRGRQLGIRGGDDVASQRTFA